MKTKYKYIHFEENKDLKEWICWNNKDDDILGFVFYDSKWKQYVVQFEEGNVFNNKCLLDIVDFLNQLNN